MPASYSPFYTMQATIGASVRTRPAIAAIFPLVFWVLPSPSSVLSSHCHLSLFYASIRESHLYSRLSFFTPRDCQILHCAVQTPCIVVLPNIPTLNFSWNSRLTLTPLDFTTSIFTFASTEDSPVLLFSIINSSLFFLSIFFGLLICRILLFCFSLLCQYPREDLQTIFVSFFSYPCSQAFLGTTQSTTPTSLLSRSKIIYNLFIFPVS